MFDTIEGLDRALLLAINSTHHPVTDVIMWYLSERWPTFLIVFLVAFSVYRKVNLKKAVEFLLGCAIVAACTDLSSNAMKHGVKRYRPTHHHELREKVRTLNNYSGGKYGFFSGHAANTFGVSTFMFLCAHWLRRRYSILLCVYPFLVSYSRVYLGVHYPSDILFGMIDGLLFGWLGFIVFNSYFLRLREQKA